MLAVLGSLLTDVAAQPRGREHLGAKGSGLAATNGVGSDRAETWLRIGVLAGFLAGAPLAAIGAGHGTYHAGIREARAQAAETHSARAVLLEPAPLVSGRLGILNDTQSWVRVRWESSSGFPRTGMIRALAGLPPGREVTVWLDASGSPVPVRQATSCRLGRSLVDGGTAVDPAQAMTSAD